jgi:hypothetical protein
MRLLKAVLGGKSTASVVAMHKSAKAPTAPKYGFCISLWDN